MAKTKFGIFSLSQVPDLAKVVHSFDDDLSFFELAERLGKGYELTMREGKKTREMGYLSFDRLHQYGACIADDPETCVAKLKDMKRRFGITEFVFWFNIGGIDRAHVERAMQLAAEQVMPHV